MTKIPSDADFKRASELMEQRFHGLDKVCENIKRQFMGMSPLYNVYVLPQGDAEFRAYVFFMHEEDIKDCKKNGITQAIEDAIYGELERAGRGKRGEITVAFEFDSDENVERQFGGDYFDRLR